MKEFTVWYAKDPNFGHGPKPTLRTLKETHVALKILTATDLEDVFHKMQGEVWSPNGEARDLIIGKGLHHTSISVGDVIHDNDNGEFYVIDFEGFSVIEYTTPDGEV